MDASPDALSNCRMFSLVNHRYISYIFHQGIYSYRVFSDMLWKSLLENLWPLPGFGFFLCLPENSLQTGLSIHKSCFCVCKIYIHIAVYCRQLFTCKHLYLYNCCKKSSQSTGIIAAVRNLCIGNRYVTCQPFLVTPAMNIHANNFQLFDNNVVKGGNVCSLCITSTTINSGTGMI